TLAKFWAVAEVETARNATSAARPSAARIGFSLLLQPIGGGVRLEGPRQPQRAPQIARARRRAGLGQPLAIDLERAVGVHEDVAVAVVAARLRHGDLLVPAVLAADGVGLHREREVLVHAAVLPPHALGVRVIAL